MLNHDRLQANQEATFYQPVVVSKVKFVLTPLGTTWVNFRLRDDVHSTTRTHERGAENVGWASVTIVLNSGME